MKKNWSTATRIILAIAAKDIVDAIKNKTTLTILLSVLFLLIAYRFVPALDASDILPRIAVYDTGNSRLVAAMEDDPEFDTIAVTSQEALVSYLGRHDLVVIGIVLPPGFDAQLAEASSITLTGYMIHWANKTQVSKAVEFAETQLTDIVGKPVHLEVAGNIVYTQKDSRGMALLVALAITFTLVMIGGSLIPHLILEEKHARTLDALLVSPASASHIVIGKALAGLFYAAAAMVAVCITYGYVITHWGVAILVLACGGLFAVALGLLIGSVAQNKAQVMIIAWGSMIVLFMALIASVEDILPDFVLKVLDWIPTVALSKAVRVSFARTAPVAAFGPELLLVVGWILLLLLVTTLQMRKSSN
ncbi:MAG: ABC transporter permease [Anaerolineae bacterium]|nr:ABC transporter permease [Anaerolineae bacterium]